LITREAAPLACPLCSPGLQVHFVLLLATMSSFAYCLFYVCSTSPRAAEGQVCSALWYLSCSANCVRMYPYVHSSVNESKLAVVSDICHVRGAGMTDVLLFITTSKHCFTTIWYS
jgi:hypothetical protein